jgi:uncharacterized phiE125 gp8 family phage protein
MEMHGCGVLKLTSAPTDLPLTLEEMRAHLNITDVDQDAMLMFYLRSAISQFDGADGLLNRALISQTYTYKLDYFPFIIELPLPPLQSVTSITYLDTAGATQTLATNQYRVLNAGVPHKLGTIEQEYSTTWPSTRSISQAVTVTFVAGYGARNTIPEHIRSLLLMTVKEAYDHRDPIVDVKNYTTPGYEQAFSRAKFWSV